MKNRFKELFARTIFPIIMGVAMLAGYLVVESGDVKNVLILGTPIVLAALILIAVSERLFPYKKAWGKNHNDIGNDAWHLVFTQVIIGKIMDPFWKFVLAGGTIFLAEKYGGTIWPHSWNLFSQLFLALLIAEFGRYWIHRWSHEISWLWRLHAVHHSPKRLYFLNAARFHPIEKILFLIPETVPFIIMGTSEKALLMYAIFNSIHGLFQHSNIYIKMGWLNYIFSMTELHRWHHSMRIRESNTNYGNNLIIWDIVFGTFFWPKKREVVDIGLINPKYPENYIGQVRAPFMGDIDKPADFYTNPKKYAEYES